MEHAAVVHEGMDALGELRIYRRPGPPEHIAFEILRESDGRAWTLRVPWSARTELQQLIDDTLRLLATGSITEFDAHGCAELARQPLGAADELVSVMLEQAAERAFAVWRRELTRQGWSWTLDVVVAPEPLAGRLCERMASGLERLLSAPAQPVPVLPPGPVMPAAVPPAWSTARPPARR